MSEKTTILDHNCPYPLAGDQRSAFINYLARVFRIPPASIEPMANCQDSSKGIWQSLKGITGVTAKCRPGAAEPSRGISMGGIVIIAGAHCPQVGMWLKLVNWHFSPGHPILSVDACIEKEVELWNKLNAFARSIIPNENDSHISNIQQVSLSTESVVMKLNSKCFIPARFTQSLKDTRLHDASCAFRDLQDFLSQVFSKTSLEWDQECCEFTFKTKSN
jgi:hypothetical protein